MARASIEYSDTIDANGAATIRIAPNGPAGRQTWMVDQISLEMILTGAPAPTARCNARHNGRLIDHCSPSHDVLADPPPIVLRPGHAITLNWSGCQPGDAVNAVAYYDDGNPE